jgi:hypothetical protein
MVRSRSETNLNRIFVDLCTSPDLRTKHEHQINYQRQYHPPLPTLQPIKSNSCSNINDLAENLTESTSSFDSDQVEKGNSSNLLSRESTAVPLTPMESTGFTVPVTTSLTMNHSLKLFETLAINHTNKSLLNEKIPKEDKKSSIIPLTPKLSTTSQDWKQQDFTNRLQNRLKSRGHLRKFFLS